MKEILILADQDYPVLNAVAPDLGVRGLAEFHIQDVLAVGTEVGQKTCQCNGKLE
jgi:hypothetical protein